MGKHWNFTHTSLGGSQVSEPLHLSRGARRRQEVLQCVEVSVTKSVGMRSKEAVLNRERPVENAIPHVLGEAENLE